MPLTADQERLLRSLHRNLRQEAIEPGHPLYVDLREQRFGEAVGDDVVRQLARDLSWVEPPSPTSLASGGRARALN